MKSPLVHNPNDKLFKSSLKDPKIAREFLSLYLPDAIKKNLDFNKISYCSTKFINAQLKESESDVLFKVVISGKEAYIYILCEHQSVVDKFMPLRLLEYMICIWNDYRHKKNKTTKYFTLPLIFPLVFFTGSGSYTGMKAIWDLCGEQSEIMQKIICSPFHIIEVDKLSDEELTSHMWAGTLGFILRKKFKTNLHEEIKKIAANLNAIGLTQHSEYLLQLFRYILNIDQEDNSIDNLIKVIHDQLSPAVEYEIMNLAEKLIEEGRAKGISEGELKGKLEIIKTMLANGVEPAFIAKNTGVSIDKIKKLQEES